MLDTSVSQLFGMRNRVINGDMRIDQRNAGAAVTLSTTNAFPVDRWFGYEDTDGVMTAQQDSSAPAGFNNSLKITTTTADASLSATQFASLQHLIEGLNLVDLAWGTASAKAATLTFSVRSSLTGTFGAALVNSDGTRSYPFTYTISAADTWESKTVTVPGDTTGTWNKTTGIGLRIRFGLGVGSTYSGTAGAWAGSNLFSVTGATSVVGTLNATWYVTGVQVEVGSTGTPFEYRDYGRELAMCYRYYYRCSTRPLGVTLNVSDGYSAVLSFPVPMRANPLLDSGATYTVGSGSAGTVQIIANGTDAVRMNNSAANWTVNVTVAVTAGFSAEL